MGKKSSSIFKNSKLEKVFLPLVEQIGLNQSVILRQISSGRSQEMQFNRFVNNKKITPKRLVNHSCKQKHVVNVPKHLLIINDTTKAVFAPHSNREFLGYVSHNTSKEGFNIHAAIALDAVNGGCYGLGGIKIFQYKKPESSTTSASAKTTRTPYIDKPFEKNERYKWFEVSKQAIDNFPDSTCYTLVGDRESDIYDLISRTVDQPWHFLYRCRTNRKLARAKEKLYETIDKWDVQHRYELDLASTPKRTAHTALLEVKFGRVSISRPNRHPDKNLPKQIEVGVIEVKENSSTVVSNEAPIHWRLLTSHPIETIDQVLEIIQWYIWRWIIEQLFRTFKSKGLAIENSELKSYHGLSNLATLALLAAVQVIQLTQAREGKTTQQLEDSFNEEEQKCLLALNKKLEGKTQKQKNPHLPNTLAFASWIVARLGGWKGYSSERPPGPITIIRGLSRFYTIFEGFYLRL